MRKIKFNAINQAENITYLSYEDLQELQNDLLTPATIVLEDKTSSSVDFEEIKENDNQSD